MGLHAAMALLLQLAALLPATGALKMSWDAMDTGSAVVFRSSQGTAVELRHHSDGYWHVHPFHYTGENGLVMTVWVGRMPDETHTRFEPETEAALATLRLAPGNNCLAKLLRPTGTASRSLFGNWNGQLLSCGGTVWENQGMLVAVLDSGLWWYSPGRCPGGVIREDNPKTPFRVLDRAEVPHLQSLISILHKPEACAYMIAHEACSDQLHEAQDNHAAELAECNSTRTNQLGELQAAYQQMWTAGERRLEECNSTCTKQMEEMQMAYEQMQAAYKNQLQLEKTQFAAIEKSKQHRDHDKKRIDSLEKEKTMMQKEMEKTRQLHTERDSAHAKELQAQLDQLNRKWTIAVMLTIVTVVVIVVVILAWRARRGRSAALPNSGPPELPPEFRTDTPLLNRLGEASEMDDVSKSLQQGRQEPPDLPLKTVHTRQELAVDIARATFPRPGMLEDVTIEYRYGKEDPNGIGWYENHTIYVKDTVPGTTEERAAVFKLLVKEYKKGFRMRVHVHDALGEKRRITLEEKSMTRYEDDMISSFYAT